MVDRYLQENQGSDSIIAVHCTHGVNRTGYFICRYMIENLKMAPEEAIKNFELARGYQIERLTYVYDLKNGCKGGAKEYSTYKKINWGKVKATERAVRAATSIEMSKETPQLLGGKDILMNGGTKSAVKFRKQGARGFGPNRQFGGDRHYGNEDGSSSTSGSWRMEQRSHTSTPYSYNRNPHVFQPRGPPPQPFFSGGSQPPPQRFFARGPPPPPFHPVRPPHQPFHTGAPPFPSTQYQQLPRQTFFPRFENTPEFYPESERRPAQRPIPSFHLPSETHQRTSTLSGFSKVYSPQVRFPSPATCNPQPEGPKGQPKKNKAKNKKRWSDQQKHARKQKNNP